MFEEICKAKKLKFTLLGRRTGYNVAMFTKIRQGYIPPKVTLISIAIALELDILEIQKFLICAGYLLSPFVWLDRKYIKAIKRTSRRTRNRVECCNEYLKKLGVKEAFLFGGDNLRE